RRVPGGERILAVAQVGARGQHDELGDYRGHREQRDRRSHDARAAPGARARGGKSPECEAEHPDTDDRYSRELPNPVVCRGDEEGDAARGGTGDRRTLELERRANRTRNGDDHEGADQEQADDPELAECLEVEGVRELAEDRQRSVLQPPGLPGSRAAAVQRMSPELVDGGAPELPPSAARAVEQVVE